MAAEDSNVIDINAARNGALVADGTDLAVVQQPKPFVPALSTETHILDVLITGGMGAVAGYLARPDMQGVVIGALGGAAFGLVEKALLGERAGVATAHRLGYGVVALGVTAGAGYLSYRWR